MNKPFICFVFGVLSYFLCFPIIGQGYSKIIEHPDFHNWAWCTENHPDGGGVMASVIDCPGSFRSDRIVLFKTKENGDLEYHKIYSHCDSISTNLQLEGPLLRVDSSFFLFWFPFDTSHLIYLTKFDYQLNEIFTRSYATEGVMLAFHMVQISPNRIILDYAEFNPEEKGIRRFIKVNLDGRELDRGQVSFRHKLYKERGSRFLRSMQLTPQGTILISLSTAESWMPSHYIIEVDTQFNLVNEFHFENLENFESRHCRNDDISDLAAPLPNGNMVIVNCRDTIKYTTPPIMIARFHPGISVYDPDGNLIWDTVFVSYSGYTINDIKVDEKGNIYCCGAVKGNNRKNITGGAIFLKMTSYGEVVWIRRIFPEFSKFALYNDIIDLEIMPDKGVLAGGYIAYKNNPNGDSDNWLIRLDSNGCITPDCTDEDILLSTTDTYDPSKKLNEVPFITYPNPVKGEVNIQLSFDPKISDRFIWVDQWGKVTQSFVPLQQRIQTLTAPTKSGLYFLTLIQNGTPIYTKKLMVEE